MLALIAGCSILESGFKKGVGLNLRFEIESVISSNNAVEKRNSWFSLIVKKNPKNGDAKDWAKIIKFLVISLVLDPTRKRHNSNTTLMEL